MKEFSIVLNRRIPTLVGLIILIAGFLAILFGLTQFQSLVSKATPTTIPSNMTFSNFNDRGFSVSWTTEEPTVGTIILENGKRFFLDDRDKGEISRSYVSHHVTLSNLVSNNDLAVILLSGTAKYGSSKEGTRYSSVPQSDICEIKDIPGIPVSCFPFNIRLPATLGVNPMAVSPKNGVVYKADWTTPLTDGVIYLSFSGSSVLSTTIGQNGTWVMPLSALRTKDLALYYSIKPEDLFSLVVRSGIETIAFSCKTKDFSSYVFPTFIIGENPKCP